MLDWCVSDVASMRMPFTGHDVARPAILAQALAGVAAAGSAGPGPDGALPRRTWMRRLPPDWAKSMP